MVWAVSLSSVELSPHVLTRRQLQHGYSEFDGEAELSPFTPPPVALPPAEFTSSASPKTVSERTSYYQVRLAFHSLPQVIREC